MYFYFNCKPVLFRDLHASFLVDLRVLKRLLIDTFTIFQRCVDTEKNV